MTPVLFFQNTADLGDCSIDNAKVVKKNSAIIIYDLAAEPKVGKASGLSVLAINKDDLRPVRHSASINFGCVCVITLYFLHIAVAYVPQ